LIFGLLLGTGLSIPDGEIGDLGAGLGSDPVCLLAAAWRASISFIDEFMQLRLSMAFNPAGAKVDHLISLISKG
jgi:hypothetical protein